MGDVVDFRTYRGAHPAAHGYVWALVWYPGVWWPCWVPVRV